MEEQKTLAELSKNISDKILDSMSLLDILDDINEGDKNFAILIFHIKNNLVSAFHEIENCRNIIHIPD